MKNVTKKNQVTAETDQRMREIINQIYDRMFEDQKNGTLKFKKEPKKANNSEEMRIISPDNTT